MKNQGWAKFISDQRRSKQLTRRGFAELASMDPSYLVLIERDGYVPRRDKVIQIAQALGVDIDRCLLLAGYAPERISIEELLNRLESSDSSSLVIELRQLYKQMAELSYERQKQLALVIAAALQLFQEIPAESKKSSAKRRKAGGIS